MKPEQRVVVVQHSTMLLQGSPVHSVSTNLGADNITYGGGNCQAARVKASGSSVWDDDWSE